jgi:hypothetical protein
MLKKGPKLGRTLQLFALLRSQAAGFMEKGKADYAMDSDEPLLSISNSYCKQCGHCCAGNCGQAERGEDGRVYCRLHGSDGPYPYEKKIACLPTAGDLDPSEWAKPRPCHTFGPHVICAEILRSENNDDVEAAAQARTDCPGAAEMAADYRSVFL